MIVLSRPYDDESIVDVYCVNYRKKPKDTSKKAEAFQAAWDKAITEAKAENPETWDVSQVLEKLKPEWHIRRQKTVEVEY